MTTTLLTGDVRDVLPTLPSESVRCCVTSPPYWGLRDYGTAKWEGGDDECKHRVPATGSTQNKNNNNNREGKPFAVDYCGICGATRVDAQLGLEKTPDEYVAKMVAVFREVRRVLRDDGTLWLNVGDSYHAAPKGSDKGWDKSGLTSPRGRERTTQIAQRASIANGKTFPGTKPKDLVGIPWMLAFALRADGWYLRSDIIWSKPNPMPESVTDRPTKAHEYLFLLSKSQRYFYDADAIAEQSTGRNDVGRMNFRKDIGMGGGWRDEERSGDVSTRNAHTVWEIATQPYAAAHFATFPEELARRCIMAGSAPGDVVLDPFGGSGTVAQVATGNGRNAIYVDLNPAYVELAKRRIGPLLISTAEGTTP